MKLYRIINTVTKEIVRYREEETKREASSGLMPQEKVELVMNTKDYELYQQLSNNLIDS